MTPEEKAVSKTKSKGCPLSTEITNFGDLLKKYYSLKNSLPYGMFSTSRVMQNSENNTIMTNEVIYVCLYL